MTSTSDIIRVAMDESERMAIKTAIWKVALMLDTEKAIELLREIADDMQSELNIYGDRR